MIEAAMRSFLDACGSPGPLFLGVEGPKAEGATWRVLDQPFAVVGRGPAVDIHLPGAELSRRHAYLQLVAGRLFCVDLGSRTGTCWDSEPGYWGWVDAEAAVRVGPYRLWPRADRAAAAGRPAGPPPAPVSRAFEQAAAEVVLEIRAGAADPVAWRVSRTLVLIGRSPACKIRLDGRGIAGVHASLIRTPTGLFAVDLLGPAGVLVNGEPTRWARLEAGDELTIGDHSVRVSPAAERDGVAAAVRSLPSPLPVSPATDLVPAPPVGKALAPRTPTDQVSPADRALVGLMAAEFAQVQRQSADRFQDTLMAVVQSFVGMQQDQMALIREELAAIRRLNEEHQALQAQVDGWGGDTRRPAVLRLVSGDAGPGTPGPAARRVLATRTLPARPANAPAGQVEPVRVEAEGEFDAQVFDRLAAIQGERQTRWRRLKETMFGKGA